jgi:hypothetical protein
MKLPKLGLITRLILYFVALGAMLFYWSSVIGQERRSSDLIVLRGKLARLQFAQRMAGHYRPGDVAYANRLSNDIEAARHALEFQ